MIRDSLATALRAALTDLGIDAPGPIHLERPAATRATWLASWWIA